MCTRVCLSTGIEEIRSRFGVVGGCARLRPHWNIGAGRVLPVIRWDPLLLARRLDQMRWGLIPSWAKNSVIVQSNRDVSTSSGDDFDPIQNISRHCLVPINNFYAWRGSDKQPFAVALADRQLMALAAVWDVWISPLGERVGCFAILTTSPDAPLAGLCKRMPAIIAPEDWDLWLGKDRSESADISGLLRPPANDRLTIWPVDRRLNSVKYDDPAILETLEVP